MSGKTNLRSWLARTAPHHVIVVDDDAEEHEIAVSAKKNRWADVERAAHAFGAVRMVCYNGKDQVIGTKEVLGPGEEEEEAAVEPEVTRTGSDVAVILPMILDACDRAAQRHQEAYAMAFAQQGQITKLIADRLSSLEKAWHSVIMAQQQQAEEAQANAADDGGMLDNMASTVMGAAMKGFGERVNGAATPSMPGNGGSIPNGEES